MHFSAEEGKNLNEREKIANNKLKQLCAQLATPLHNVVVQDFYEMKPKIEQHKLHEVLDKMPKGALHHLHTTASPSVEEYIKLTYFDEVAYNEREGQFKVLLGHEQVDGFCKCNEVRAFHKDPKEYDNMIRDAILLTDKETRSLESHDIWKGFQPKFTRVGDLCKYVVFFKQLLRSTLMACAEQNILVVELRHTTGSLYD